MRCRGGQAEGAGGVRALREGRGGAAATGAYGVDRRGAAQLLKPPP